MRPPPSPIRAEDSRHTPTAPLPCRIRGLALLVPILSTLLAAGTATSTSFGAEAPRLLEARRIVMLGDSITYAGEWVEFVETWVRVAHPESKVEVLNLGLPSETVSGLSEPGHAGGAFPRPDVHERLGRVLERTKPDVVFAAYGMNDGIYFPESPERFGRFQDGLRRFREKAGAAGAHVVHVTPSMFDRLPLAGRTLPAGRGAYPQPFDGYDGVLEWYSDWLRGQRTAGWDVVDVHGPYLQYVTQRRETEPAFTLAGDGVHPNTQGHWLIAREALRRFGAPEALVKADTPDALWAVHPKAREVHGVVRQRQRLLRDAWLTATGHQRPGIAAGKPLPEAEAEAARLSDLLRTLASAPIPGRTSDWYGFTRYDFEVDGRKALVVAPHYEAPGRPWAWHGEFFGHRPLPDLALLGRGFHVVYLEVPDMLGSPKAVAHWNALYRQLTDRHGFSRKPVLVGLSRGGLYCYNWAIANPTCVGALYGDAPVCDFKSWPGGKGKGPGSRRDWNLVLEQYGFASDAEAIAYRGNPVDNLEPLARAGVPLLHVYGDADEVVPWDENTGVVAERYRRLGGSITLIAKPGVKHHPHGLDDSTPIVRFLWTHGTGGLPDPGPRDRGGRPLIKKRGTVDLDLVETTPVVFQDKLWRFEWVRDGYWNNTRKTNYFRFIDKATGTPTPPFADGYEFGSACVHDGQMLVTGTRNRGQIDLFVSRDLRQWETRPVLAAGRYGIFNTSLCRTKDDFVLMFEIDRPAEEAGVAFTARFLRSPDLRTWTLTPPECQYSKDRYTAPHALRWLDGWFYDFYLESHEGWEMRVVRSRDLQHWEPSPLNPVLRASPEDRRVANEQLTPAQRERIARAVNRNNSDIDFVTWQGRLEITYSWGNQEGVEHLAEASYDGPEETFLRAWFPPAPP